jgi:hypothetical protein
MRMEPKCEHDRALDGEVDSKEEEGESDQAQADSLPVFVGARQLPDDYRARPDLDERIEAEPRKGDRPSRDGSDGQDDDSDHVPTKGDPL